MVALLLLMPLLKVAPLVRNLGVMEQVVVNLNLSTFQYFVCFQTRYPAQELTNLRGPVLSSICTAPFKARAIANLYAPVGIGP